MEAQSITIRSADSAEIVCRCAIIIPDSVLEEPGHIRAMTTDSAAHSKHQFHTLTQIALFELQEGELEVEASSGPLTVHQESETVHVPSGIVLYLDVGGDLHLYGDPTLDARKFLQLAHRYCTRWVRLDI
jgi:hypothetical protein